MNSTQDYEQSIKYSHNFGQANIFTLDRWEDTETCLVLDDNGYLTWCIAIFVVTCIVSVTGLVVWVWVSARSVVTARDVLPLPSSVPPGTRKVSVLDPNHNNVHVKSEEIENVYESIPEEYIDNRPSYSRNISLGKS